VIGCCKLITKSQIHSTDDNESRNNKICLQEYL